MWDQLGNGVGGDFAKVNGNEVEVWSDAVPEPAAVRYSWAANPVGNLFSEAGLPASPFRTDNWDQ